MHRSFLFAVIVALFISETNAGQVDPILENTLQSAAPMQMVQVILYMKDQVDLVTMEESLRRATAPGKHIDPVFRYRTILTALQDVANQTQEPFVERLSAITRDENPEIVSRFWIRNIIVLRGTPDIIRQIAALPEVETAFLDGFLQRELPETVEEAVSNPEASEAGLRAINAHKLWALGYNGTGRIVMNIDTGVEGNNQSFNGRWRGNVPGVHAGWAWFDPETNTTFPTDGDGGSQHGTHTMGIMCGLYTATNDTLGVAPGARWIAAKTLNSSPHTSRSIAAFQWAANPDSNASTMDDVPDAISCSWFDPNISGTECTGASGYYAVIDAVEALGTAVVFSAGNNGPNPSTITAPKNRLTTAVNIFSVGAVDGNNPAYPIASFSSRGPSICPGPDSLRIKPEVSAPGVNVRSASGTNGFRSLSGTSMACPHVAGSIALLRSVAPFLTGTEIKHILMNTAVDLGTAGEDNNYGHGIIDLWAAYQQLPLNMGYVRGQVTSGGNPLSGVEIDFADSVQQLPTLSDGSGNFLVSAQVDTNITSVLYTLRAEKFGYITYTDTITVSLDDTVDRDIALTPAPGGTLEILAHHDTANMRVNVRVYFGDLLVVDDSTHEVTGTLTAPLPKGTYKVVVDPAPPYGNNEFPNVDIDGGSTTSLDALLEYVIALSSSEIRDTLVSGQISAQTLTLINTTSDSVPFRLSDDEALFRAAKISKPKPSSQQVFASVQMPKGAESFQPGFSSPDARGGPDPFGYEWIDSDEPDGPVFNWVDITSTGTLIPTGAWRGSSGTANADDGRVHIGLPFTFSYYGNVYDSLKVCTNGWLGFDLASTSTEYTNSAIPSTGQPNNTLFPWWDDLNLQTSGTVHYLYDSPGNRFIVQFTNVPHYTGTAGVYTFQVILSASGTILYQYLDMQQTVNSASVGMENAGGTNGLLVVFNSTYMHNSLAVQFSIPDAEWLSENPSLGVLPPLTNQDITIAFNAGGLSTGTTYNANIAVFGTHPDLGTSPIVIPASLTVQLADSAVLILESGSLTFGATQVNTSRGDTLTIRNGGLLALDVSSISTTNGDFTVSPTSATIFPGDSTAIIVSYNPVTVENDTGRIVFLSNSQGSPQLDVLLNGTAIGAPLITVHPSTLGDTLQQGAVGAHTVTIANGSPAPSAPLILSLSESVAWLSVSPAADTLAAGDSASFDITFNASGQPLGTQLGDVTIASNDPANPVLIITCLLDVTGGPVVSVAQSSFTFQLDPSDVATDTLTIRNTGTSDLVWTITDVPVEPAVVVPQPDVWRIARGKGEPDIYHGYPVTEGAGGPDSAGYRWIDSDEPGGPAYNWFDISSIGTQITGWVGSSGTANADDGAVVIDIPFAFPFYGNVFDSLRVVTNGWMSFTSASTVTAYSNIAIPATATPNDVLYPFWDDFDLRTSGTVHYYHDAPNGRFIIQYTNVPHYTGTTGVYTFQVILNSSGAILYQYFDMQGTVNSSTIGIENGSGTVGLQVVFNNTYVHNNLAVLFAKDVSWLAENPTSGTVAPGDSAQVAVTVSTAGISGLTALANLSLESNDLGNSPLLIPVTVNINPTAVEDETGIPDAFGLSQNYPNPFNPSTQIEFAVPENAHVNIRIYDLLGKEVKALWSGGTQAGFHSVTWDGTNKGGVTVSSGIYLYKMDATASTGKVFTRTMKLLFLK